MEQASFPLFRRSINARHYYRIGSLRSFTEVQLLGGRALVHDVEAVTYPEQVLVRELIDLAAGRYLAIDQEEFERMLARVR